MQSISTFTKSFELKQAKTSFKNQKEELIFKMTEDINLLREGTTFKPTTTKVVALRLNLNPFYAKDIGAVEELYKYCNSKRNYGKFFADCTMYKK